MQNYSVRNQNILNMNMKANKSPIRKYITPNLTPINRDINNNNSKDKNINGNDNNNSINISKNEEKVSPKSQSNLPFQTDGDFSNLLTLMANAKQKKNSSNSINKAINNNFKSAKNISINNNNNLNISKYY